MKQTPKQNTHQRLFCETLSKLKHLMQMFCKPTGKNETPLWCFHAHPNETLPRKFCKASLKHKTTQGMLNEATPKMKHALVVFSKTTPK